MFARFEVTTGMLLKRKDFCDVMQRFPDILKAHHAFTFRAKESTKSYS
jgi:hypothetical protein